MRKTQNKHTPSVRKIILCQDTGIHTTIVVMVLLYNKQYKIGNTKKTALSCK